jgi:hypothetical protein
MSYLDIITEVAEEFTWSLGRPTITRDARFDSTHVKFRHGVECEFDNAAVIDCVALKQFVRETLRRQARAMDQYCGSDQAVTGVYGDQFAADSPRARDEQARALIQEACAPVAVSETPLERAVRQFRKIANQPNAVFGATKKADEAVAAEFHKRGWHPAWSGEPTYQQNVPGWTCHSIVTAPVDPLDAIHDGKPLRELLRVDELARHEKHGLFGSYKTFFTASQRFAISAWHSSELRRLTAEARERERTRVVCDDGEGE